MSSFSFPQAEINKAQQTFNRVSLDPNQRELVGGVAKIMCEYIDINELAMKGFLMRAARQWQKDNQKEISEVAEYPPQKRLQVVENLVNRINAIFTKILIDKEQEDKLNKAISDAFNFYKSKYAFR